MKGPEIIWTAIHEPNRFAEALEVERTYRETMEIAEDGKSGIRHKDGKAIKVMGLWGQSGRKVDGIRYRSWGEYAEKMGLLDPARLEELRQAGEYDTYPDISTAMCFCRVEG
jgi:hypothetical protein